MGWQELLSQKEIVTVPWTGGRSLTHGARHWSIKGRMPTEHGWHEFEVDGSRKARWKGAGEQDFAFDEGRKTVTGYLVGNYLLPDGVSVVLDPNTVTDQGVELHLISEDLDRFSRVVGVKAENGDCIFLREEFPLGPEDQVRAIFQDRGDSVVKIPELTPSLDLAFRWETLLRLNREEARRAAEAARIAAEAAAVAEARRAELAERLGTGAGRRALAQVDFEAAASAALATANATLLDHRRVRGRDEWVVKFRFMDRRFECTCDTNLQIIDSGICLTDHNTGERGDTYFTLESLPTVMAQAINEHRLHIYRHVGDYDYED
jgi:hypothetical protein